MKKPSPPLFSKGYFSDNKDRVSWSDYFLKNQAVGLISGGFFWILGALVVLHILINYWHILLILLAVAGFSFLLYKYFKWKNER